MKTKITLILSALVMSINLLFAQSPGTINYQGVARDTSGNPIANQQIRLRFKINDASANGPTEFTEVRKVTTSASGLFNCQIGGTGAISQIGSLLTLPWHDGPKFLKVEMDPTGGVNYTNMGTQQLASVPYALHAKQAEGLAPNKFLPFSQLDTTGAKPGSLSMLFFDGFSYLPTSLLPYNVADPNMVSFAITNTSAVGGQAIYGMNTVDHINATGVRGECNKANGRGVYGKAIGASAFGVYAENNTGTGIKGFSTSGTAIKAESTNGYALDINGKVKIAGGNTSPSFGAILTSDSSGNSTWKKSRVGFKAIDIVSNYDTVTNGAYYTRLHFKTEEFDLQNNYNLLSGSVNSNSSKFVAPVSGIYSFDAECVLGVSNSQFLQGKISINYQTSNNTYLISTSHGVVENHSTWGQLYLKTGSICHLNQGDKVQVIVQQFNSASIKANLVTNGNEARFSGYLIYAD